MSIISLLITFIIVILAVYCTSEIKLLILKSMNLIRKLFILFISTTTNSTINITTVMRHVSLIFYGLVNVWTSCRVTLTLNRFVNLILNWFIHLFMSFIVHLSASTRIVSHGSLNNWQCGLKHVCMTNEKGIIAFLKFISNCIFNFPFIILLQLCLCFLPFSSFVLLFSNSTCNFGMMLLLQVAHYLFYLSTLFIMCKLLLSL